MGAGMEHPLLEIKTRVHGILLFRGHGGRALQLSLPAGGAPRHEDLRSGG